jgi:hypothetical protein
MRTVRSRRLVAAVAAPLLVVSLAACGSDKGGDKTSAAGDSSASSEKPSTPDLKAGEEIDPADFLAQVKSGVEGATTSTTSMKMSISGMEITMEGQVDYTADPPEMAITMSMPMLGEDPMDMRIVDGFAYMNMGALTDNKFVKSSLDDPNGALGDMTGLTDSMDPAKSLENFSAGFDKVVYVGPESVDGVDAGHYQLTVDTTKIGSALSELGATGTDPSSLGLPDTLTYDVWLDSESRMTKSVIELGDLGSMEMTASNWGEPVDIQAPSADQITDMPAFGAPSDQG